MTRDAQIPLFLWIATAVVAHLIWGGGADRVVRVLEERVEMREFAASVRRFVRGEGKPIEVALLDEQPQAKETERPASDEPVKDDTKADEKPSDKDDAPPDKQKPRPLPEEKAKTKPPEQKKPEPEKPPEKKAEPVVTPPSLPPDELKRRISVKQHVQDQNQPDNPDAEFLGDQANRVKEQSQARITSTDHDDAKPTPGSGAQSSNDPSNPGDSDVTRIMQSDDHKGEPDRAPREQAPPSELRIAEQPARAPKPAAAGIEQRHEGAQHGSPRAENDVRRPAQTAQAPQPALHAADAVPETLASNQGGWEIAREKSASVEQAGRKGRKRRELPPQRSSGFTGLLGLGATGTTPGGVNLNLSPEVAVATIGRDQLIRERIADGERRRSQHAGRWRPAGIERWRSAIENYVPMVKPGNQTALNTARAPFASYLNQVHNRIHPIFADGFLASLDNLPASHPMNRPEISTNLEIVLDREEGRVQRMGVTKTSGVTAFDVNALEAVDRAQPFGPPPRDIVSPDGNVYFHWEFHRNRDEACSTYFARPFILKVQPKSAPPTPEPSTPPASEEPVPERHGLREPTLLPRIDHRHGPARTTLALVDAAK